MSGFRARGRGEGTARLAPVADALAVAASALGINAAAFVKARIDHAIAAAVRAAVTGVVVEVVALQPIPYLGKAIVADG